jgi:D-alanyl-D-alanine carboxypeptidase (penicillin-binding protein 5/6)
VTLEGPAPTRRSRRDRPARAAEVLPPRTEDDASALPLLVAAAALDEDTAARTAHPGEADVAPAPQSEPAPATTATAADPEHEGGPGAVSVPVVIPPAALSWIDERGVVARTAPRLQLEAHPTGYTPVTVDLLPRAPRRSPWRPGVLVPAGLILVLVLAYCGTVLLWPLYAVAPSVMPLAVQPAAAAAAAPAWPAQGSAAVTVDGVGPAAASSPDAVPMASITKVVTALVVLEQAPLAVGEQGRSFQFTSADRATYWAYRTRGESALDVPVGGTLTEYQLLQGMLIGSAGNYADRLASTFWPTESVFADAANTWLTQHGLGGIHVVEPTGIDPANTASAESLLALGKRALANPVIAEIVRTAAVDLPGAGHVENTNDLLADPGVVGIKTGSLDTFNLLAAQDVTVGDTTVRVYADALGQVDDAARDEATRALFAQATRELQLSPSVPKGTTVGQVDTLWGDPIGIVSATDASVVLWNGAVAEASTSFDLGDAREKGETVGSLTATGPKNAATVDLVLADDVDGPSPWWRLTHPLELFGLL